MVKKWKLQTSEPYRFFSSVYIKSRQMEFVLRNKVRIPSLEYELRRF